MLCPARGQKGESPVVDRPRLNLEDLVSERERKILNLVRDTEFDRILRGEVDLSEATGGQLKAVKGKYFDKDCNQTLDYEAEVIDLNGDGRPEVFASIQGTCLSGATGVFVNLYIKNSKGQWKPQFGFPGVYKVLATRYKGCLDIEIGGPGNYSPVWRWNGLQSALHKKCR